MLGIDLSDVLIVRLRMHVDRGDVVLDIATRQAECSGSAPTENLSPDAQAFLSEDQKDRKVRHGEPR